MEKVKANNEVTEYIQKLADKSGQWQVDVCESLRNMVHETIPEVEDKLQYGKPHFFKNGEFVAVIHAGKDKISFMIFNASEIEPIKGVLRAMGNGERKTADITEEQEVDYSLLASLLKKTTKFL